MDTFCCTTHSHIYIVTTHSPLTLLLSLVPTWPHRWGAFYFPIHLGWSLRCYPSPRYLHCCVTFHIYIPYTFILHDPLHYHSISLRTLTVLTFFFFDAFPLSYFTFISHCCCAFLHTYLSFISPTHSFICYTLFISSSFNLVDRPLRSLLSFVWRLLAPAPHSPHAFCPLGWNYSWWRQAFWMGHLLLLSNWPIPSPTVIPIYCSGIVGGGIPSHWHCWHSICWPFILLYLLSPTLFHHLAPQVTCVVSGYIIRRQVIRSIVDPHSFIYCPYCYCYCVLLCIVIYYHLSHSHLFCVLYPIVIPHSVVIHAVGASLIHCALLLFILFPLPLLVDLPHSHFICYLHCCSLFTFHIVTFIYLFIYVIPLLLLSPIIYLSFYIYLLLLFHDLYCCYLLMTSPLRSSTCRYLFHLFNSPSAFILFLYYFIVRCCLPHLCYFIPHLHLFVVPALIYDSPSLGGWVEWWWWWWWLGTDVSDQVVVVPGDHHSIHPFPLFTLPPPLIASPIWPLYSHCPYLTPFDPVYIYSHWHYSLCPYCIPHLYYLVSPYRWMGDIIVLCIVPGPMTPSFICIVFIVVPIIPIPLSLLLPLSFIPHLLCCPGGGSRQVVMRWCCVVVVCRSTAMERPWRGAPAPDPSDPSAPSPPSLLTPSCCYLLIEPSLVPFIYLFLYITLLQNRALLFSICCYLFIPSGKVVVIVVAVTLLSFDPPPYSLCVWVGYSFIPWVGGGWWAHSVSGWVFIECRWWGAPPWPPLLAPQAPLAPPHIPPSFPFIPSPSTLLTLFSGWNGYMSCISLLLMCGDVVPTLPLSTSLFPLCCYLFIVIVLLSCVCCWWWCVCVICI